MKTIKPETFFKKIIKEYKTQYEDYREKQINIFMLGIEKIKYEYLKQFGYEEIDFETFKENINQLQKWWWDDNTPFGMFSFKENEDFFEKHCIGITYIYNEIYDNGLDLPLFYRNNDVYYNMNYNLQKYCFHFIDNYFNN